MGTPVVSASYQNYQYDAVSSQLTYVTGDSELIDMYKGVLYTPLSNCVSSKHTTHKNWKYNLYDFASGPLQILIVIFHSKIGLGILLVSTV